MSKPFIIVYRYTGSIFPAFRQWNKWSSYKTERDRENALVGLKKSHGHVRFEFAKKEDVE